MLMLIDCDIFDYDSDSFLYFSFFDNFERSSIPLSLEEYLSYKNRVTNFVEARSKKIKSFSTIN